MKNNNNNFRIKLSDNLFIVYKKLSGKDQLIGSHYYDIYDKTKTIENLFNLQIKQSFGNIILLINNSDINTTLTHINVFDSFCYTLVPQDINEDIYSKIYNYFFYSPMSVSYITWIGSLILRPSVKSNTIDINGKTINLGGCGKCFLEERNCSKIVSFLNIFHPEKEFSIKELNIMCEILKEFSIRLYKDFEEKFFHENYQAFAQARQSVGIKNHYWLNPWGIY